MDFFAMKSNQLYLINRESAFRVEMYFFCAFM